MLLKEIMIRLGMGTGAGIAHGALSAGLAGASGALGAAINGHSDNAGQVALMAASGNAVLMTCCTCSTFLLCPLILECLSCCDVSSAIVIGLFGYLGVLNLATVLGYLINLNEATMDLNDVLKDTNTGLAVMFLPFILMACCCFAVLACCELTLSCNLSSPPVTQDVEEQRALTPGSC